MISAPSVTLLKVLLKLALRHKLKTNRGLFELSKGRRQRRLKVKRSLRDWWGRPDVGALTTEPYSHVRDGCLQLKALPKYLFHIKCLFELNEFKMYDLLSQFTAPHASLSVEHQYYWQPFKLNFFYRIKSSMRLFRLHTLRLFIKRPKTERRATAFFSLLKPVQPMSYFWLIEFGLATLLTKLGFFASLEASKQAVRSSIVFVNFDQRHSFWSHANPGDLIQIPVNSFLLQQLKFRILAQTEKRKALINAIKAFITRPTRRIYRRKMLKANTVSRPGLTGFKVAEIDFRVFGAVMLPITDFRVFYQYATIAWLNYWNFRTLNWKYSV